MVTSKKGDSELAKAIVMEKLEAVHYKELIEEILKRQGKDLTPENMVTVYTSINMDHELVHVGDGYWDLRR